MNVLVNAIAAENELPPTLLVPRAALERVARELPSSHEAFVANVGPGAVETRAHRRTAMALR